MYICIYIYIYIRIYIYIYIYMCIHIYIYIYTYIVTEDKRRDQRGRRGCARAGNAGCARDSLAPTPMLYLSIYLSIYLCVYLSIYLFVFLFVYLSVYLSVYFIYELNTPTFAELLLDVRVCARGVGGVHDSTGGAVRAIGLSEELRALEHQAVSLDSADPGSARFDSSRVVFARGEVSAGPRGSQAAVCLMGHQSMRTKWVGWGYVHSMLFYSTYSILLYAILLYVLYSIIFYSTSYGGRPRQVHAQVAKTLQAASDEKDAKS